MSEQQTINDPAVQSDGEIIARPQFRHRLKQTLLGLALIGYGAWSIWDGYVAWPRDNARIAEYRQQILAAEKAGNPAEVTRLTTEMGKLTERTATSIGFNKVIGWVLPPLGVWLIARTFWVTRGQLRLSGGVLNIPGHPPIPLDRVTELDKARWDKKGIAFVSYELPDGRKGRFRLDDVWYDRPPTDAIYDQVKAQFPSEQPAESERPADPAA